ncbi:hypothetical protein BO78DRAFT_410411 [Aspergillus sclerotiicarbonarius CBS 121057]|uniref:Uncharacterized protein n=1 Tax=Aspergillus sclerotiicarbonarius (strain CBS 121057 / IBT 28362) TaxID=1448318 RepID=A0A319DY23_ASPSB|nr:hypothetical protein BO78DRAFT_410411 [Aspergillus sclerotiicarbonarius CBS 121057]
MESGYKDKIQALESALQTREGDLFEQQRHFQVAIENRDKRINYLRRRIIGLEEKVQLHERERRELESAVATAQEGALRSMARGSCMPMEDRTVRDALTKLQEALRVWARTYSVGSIADMHHVPNEKLEHIIKLLEGYCIQDGWDSLIAQLKIPPTRVPIILVQALLAKSIYTVIFANPFFAFATANRDWRLPGQGEVQVLYETMIRHDPGKAHSWRSLMLRVLSSPPPDPTMQPSLSLLLESLAIDLAASLLNGPVSVLLRPAKDDQERERQALSLRKLYHTAGELALSLWTQRTFMKCHGLHHLRTFHSSSEQMTAHRLHQLDEDDNRLDGNTILLCIQPLVLAFGNEHGEHYDISKVWAKATVLVADPEAE